MHCNSNILYYVCITQSYISLRCIPIPLIFKLLPNSVSTHAQACTGMHRHAQAYTGMHRHAQACTGMHRHAQACTGMHRHAHTLTHASVCRQSVSVHLIVPSIHFLPSKQHPFSLPTQDIHQTQQHQNGHIIQYMPPILDKPILSNQGIIDNGRVLMNTKRA